MFDLNIYTPKQVVFSLSVKHVQAPGESGNMGFGENHAPFIVNLRAGILSVDTVEGKKINYYVSGGFLQVENNSMDLLVENIEAPEGVDKKRAKEAEQRALDRLKHLSPGMDIPRALSALDRARKRMALVDRSNERHNSR